MLRNAGRVRRSSVLVLERNLRVALESRLALAGEYPRDDPDEDDNEDHEIECLVQAQLLSCRCSDVLNARLKSRARQQRSMRYR